MFSGLFLFSDVSTEPVCHKPLRRHIRGYFHGIEVLHLPRSQFATLLYMYEMRQICHKFFLGLRITKIQPQH